MNKKTFQFIAIILGMTVAGVLLGLLLKNLEFLDTVLPQKGTLNFISIIYLVIIAFGAIAVHELGHLLTGLAQGFKFQLFIVGFLGIKRDEADRVKVFFNKDWNTFGGVAASSPTKPDQSIARKFANVLLAGPIASLLFALICFVLINGVGQPFKFYLFFGGMISFALFLATTLPAKTGLFYTDRKRYQRLTGGGKEQEIELALLQANALKTADASLQSMEVKTLEKITEDPSPIFRYIGYFYLYEYHLAHEEKRNEIQASMKALEEDLPRFFVQQMQKEIQKLEKKL